MHLFLFMAEYEDGNSDEDNEERKNKKENEEN
jgi:hypothetical protein